ncbi:acetyl-CoA synthetase-like protein [Hesseltinella vesiculosa]|uniref:Acetyl-CoA synthetase-like protein n=1 Tax=Hesseltinella vesiculosa TaxID=101127 RepID=A0A1X2GNK1_9FUNG|nr:acetyl-CoA synthetase-like protein [Hesseltinella vesiculosa]
MKTSTVETGAPQPNGGRIRRSALSPDAIVRVPASNVHTLYDVLQHSAKKYATRNAFGRRRVEKMIEEEKEVTKFIDGKETKQMKKWKYFQLSPYEYVTYAEASVLTHAIGNAFISLGLEPKAKVEIFSSTTMDWLLMAHGLFTQNMTIVTAYETLGEEGLLHSMNEAEVEAIFTSVDLLPVVARAAKKCPTLKVVVYSGEPNATLAETIKQDGQVQDVLTMDALIQLGKDFPKEPRRPEPEDLCCIMYTSGSTGNPKGVMLTHKNIVAAIGGVNLSMGHHIGNNDSMMAYLPLAHVLEFTVENSCVFWGVTLGYGSIRTLTDASVRNCKGDIKEFRPTMMTGVPAVWESIRKGILTKINASSPAAQKIFEKAYTTKSWLFERGMPSKILDAVVFSKIREQVGGRLRLALSGGAPLSVETQKFLSICLCPVLGGFGISMSTLMTPELFGFNHVGSPVPCCEIKLVDVPDANYLSTNLPKPQGEVWVRGPSVTKGYWKREDITKETITEDGWLQTGDIAEWNENGTLSIIDRKKNLVKLSNGEYIALEKLESIYKSSLFVGNLCVYADSLVGKPVALVFPLEAALRKWAGDNGVEEKDWHRLCQLPEVRKAVLGSLTDVGKQAGLKPAEFLFDVYLCDEEWTSDNGLLTAAQKIKRQDINKKFKDELEVMNQAQRS